MTKADSIYKQARSHHVGGRLSEARNLYCQVLELAPQHAPAWHFLGLIAHAAGEGGLGATCLERAAALAPTNAECQGNLGAFYLSGGRLADAEGRLREALRLQPDYPEAHNNLGVIYLRGDRHEEAIRCFERSLRGNPGGVEPLRNLALTHVLRADYREGERLAREVLLRLPDDPFALVALGRALTGLARQEEAVAAFVHALRVRPNWSDAYLHLAEVLRLTGRLEEAETCFRATLRLEPENYLAHNNLGLVLARRNDRAGARACYEEALRLRPGYATALGNLGGLLLAEGQTAAAAEYLRRGLELIPADHVMHSNFLFALSHSPAPGPAEVLAEHLRWAEVHAARDPIPPHRNDPDPSRRLKIGYVSADFCEHAAAKFFEPVLAYHDRGRFEITCYANLTAADDVTARLRSLADRWLGVAGLPDRKLADVIRADGIDLLVDLSGHSAGNRLRAFSYGPAPVQVTYLGYPNTTGLTSVDYLLTDEVFHPPGSPSFTTEEVWRLPRGYCTFIFAEGRPAVGPLPAARTGGVTFGSLHKLAKLNDGVLDLWAEVLRAVPGSRLLAYRDALSGGARERLHQALVARGIPAERFELRHRHTHPDYLDVYNEIDVTLDTFPYGGGTTVLESLWMGVPVLTLTGTPMAQRMAASCLTRVGLSSFIAETPESYVGLARRWASDPGALAQVRRGLRTTMAGTICDAAGVTRGLEEAYREMWRLWCAKQAGR